jgi:hypothetical protein
MSEGEDAGYIAHAAQIQAAQRRFEELISEVTGWQGVEDLAKWVVDLLIANQGVSAAQGVRPPCWQAHVPVTVAEFTNLLTQVSGRPSDDPIIQTQTVAYRQQLRVRFGL